MKIKKYKNIVILKKKKQNLFNFKFYPAKLIGHILSMKDLLNFIFIFFNIHNDKK